MTSDIQQRAARVRLLLMDVDGVLTDGTIYNVPSLTEPHILETKGFNSQDGIALQWLTWCGIHTGVISGRVSRAVEVRAEQVGMTYIYQGHIEKLPILEDIIARSSLPAGEVAYMGDDLTDLPVMRSVGLAWILVIASQAACSPTSPRRWSH